MRFDELEDLLLLEQEKQNTMREFKSYFVPIKTIHSYNNLDIYKLNEYLIWVDDEKEIKFISYRPRHKRGLGLRCFITYEELLWQLSYTFNLCYNRLTGKDKCDSIKEKVVLDLLNLSKVKTNTYNFFTKDYKIGYCENGTNQWKIDEDS